MSAAVIPDSPDPSPDSSLVSASDVASSASRSGFLAEALAWGCLAIVVACSLLVPHFGYGQVLSIAKGFSVWQIGFALAAFLFAALYAGAKGNATRSQRLFILWLMIAMAVAWHGMATSWAIGRSNVKYAIAGFWQSTAFWLLLPTTAWLVGNVRDAGRVLNLLWIATVFVLVSGLWDSVLLAKRFGNAGLLVAVWPLLLGWFVQAIGIHRDGTVESTAARWGKWTWVVPVVLMFGVALALLMNTIATAWIAAAIATLLAMLFDPLLRADALGCFKQRPVGAIAFVLAMFALVGAAYFLDPRFVFGVDQSFDKSFSYWKGTSDLIGKQPWAGFGSLNFESSYMQLESFSGVRPPTNPRNFLLEIAHVGGWPLLGLSLLLLGAVSIRGCCRKSFGATDHSISQDRPAATDRLGQRSVASISFWVAACLAVIAYIIYAIFFDTGAMAGGEPIALGASLVFGLWINRNQSMATSVQAFVQNHSVLLLVSFWGTLVHFLTSEGWMVPAEMIVAIVALGLWIAARSGGDAAIEATKEKIKARGTKRWYGAVIATILLGLWGWSMAEPLARSNQVWFSMVSAGNDVKEVEMSPDAYARSINSVRFDPDLPELGMRYCVRMLGKDLSANTKERWLQQFQQSRTWLIERDPTNALAYASAGRFSIRACESMMRIPASSQDMVSPGVGGGRRGQSNPGRRGPAMSPIAARMLNESLGYYREAASRAPGNSEIQLQAAVAAAMSGNWKACESFYDRAEKIETDNLSSKRSQHEALVWVPKALIPVMESQAKRGGKLNDDGNVAWDALVQHVGQNEIVDGDMVRGVFRSLLKSKE
jgi:hypothetical protein